MALVIDYKSGRRVDSYKVASWESENRFQAALYMLAVEKLLGKRAVGGVYVALGSEDPRPRGMLADDVPGLGSGWFDNDVVPRDEFEEKLDWARERIACHGRGDPPRGAHLHARLLRVSGRLLVPVAVPVRAVSLTAEQQQVVDRREGPLLVRAGAGTGKTTVLVERFVRAVVDDGVPVEGMLAITFTDKAAAEMRERVRARFLELGRREDARSAEGASISTIHGFCGRLLRTHALSAGHRPRLPRARRARGRAGGGRRLRPGARGLPRARGDRPRGPDRLELVASYTPDGLRDMVRTAYSHLRSRGERHPSLAPAERPRPAGEAERLEAAARAALAELAPRGRAGRGEGERDARSLPRAPRAAGGRAGWPPRRSSRSSS